MPDTTKLSRRRFLKATGGAATAAALAGCTGGGDGEDTTTEDTGGEDTATTTATQEEDSGTELSGSIFQRILTGTITTLDPVAATDTASGILIQQVFDCLMSYPDGLPTVENELAADYTVSDDFTTYTFQLEDATYHDGRQVTASDFVYAWERLAASENSRRSYFILSSIGMEHETDDDGNYVPGSLGVEAASDTELVVTLTEPFHSTLEMLAYTSFAAVPEGIVGDVGDYDGEMEYTEFASENPIGSGPFEFAFWEKGTAAAVTKYDDYYGDVPQVDNVRWQVIEDDTAAYNYAMNENADYFGIPTAQYDPAKVQVETTDESGREIGTYGPVRNGKTVNYVGVPTLSIYYVGFNMEKVPKPVRQAFAYVLNQNLMVEEVFKGRGSPAYMFTPPTIYPGGAQAAQDKVDSDYPYSVGEADIEAARQVMEDAGYGPDNKFELQWTQYDSPTWEEMATILRDQLASAHVNMQIEKADFSTLLERGRNGQLEVYTLGWIADWPAPDNFLQLLNPPQTQVPANDPISYLNWNEETGDAAQTATDAYSRVQDNPAPTDDAQSVRDEAYVEIETSNWEDVAMLPIFNNKEEAFWYDTVEIEPFGGMGPSRQKLNNVTLNR